MVIENEKTFKIEDGIQIPDTNIKAVPLKKKRISQRTNLSGFKIEKGIPFRPGRGGGKRNKGAWEEIFSSMKVGDSFALTKKEFRPCLSSASKWGKELKMRFACRRTGAGGRCWRIR